MMEESTLSLVIVGIVICVSISLVALLDKPIKRWTKEEVE
ncbi:hypothetical protein ACVW18_005874 [Bacillus thuringiensis]